MPWLLTEPGKEIRPPAGEDALFWAWELASEDGADRRTVLVKISETAMSSDDVSIRLDQARQSNGQTEINRILEWEEPPEEIEFHSKSTSPTIRGGRPGSPLQEITQITDWMEGQGILLAFSGRVRGRPDGLVEYTAQAANLIDEEGDLVHRVETGSRLEAAREAAEWLRQQLEALKTGGASITAKAGGTGTTSLGPSTGDVAISGWRIGEEEAALLTRYDAHLVFTAPTPDDPDSGWMVEAVDDQGNNLGIAVGRTWDDAVLTILDDIRPPEDRD